MRRTVVAATLLALSSLALAQGRVATLHASKIYCEACAAVITKALRAVPGVSKVSVDVDGKEVSVHFDPAKTSLEDLTAATAKKGFPSTVRKVEP